MERKAREHKIENLRVPPQGNLGLLAHGHLGLRAWRQARREHQNRGREIR